MDQAGALRMSNCLFRLAGQPNCHVSKKYLESSLTVTQEFYVSLTSSTPIGKRLMVCRPLPPAPPFSVDMRVDDRVPSGHGIEDIEIDAEEMTYTPNILVPRDSGYPVRSRHYMIPWINLGGLFEFKILQHVPDSEFRAIRIRIQIRGCTEIRG